MLVAPDTPIGRVRATSMKIVGPGIAIALETRPWACFTAIPAAIFITSWTDDQRDRHRMEDFSMVVSER